MCKLFNVECECEWVSVSVNARSGNDSVVSCAPRLVASSMEGHSKGKKRKQKDDRVQPLPPTFGKPALLSLLVAVFIYGYQVRFFFGGEALGELQYISQTGFFTYWISKLSPLFGEEPVVETVFSKVVIEADIPRRDAVVQAFKV